MSNLIAWLLLRWQYVAIALLVALLGAQQVRVDHAQTAEAVVAKMFALHLKRDEQAARIAEAAARAEEARTEAEKEKVADEARTEIEAARVAAAGAAHAADGLRSQLARTVAAARLACANPKPAQ